LAIDDGTNWARTQRCFIRHEKQGWELTAVSDAGDTKIFILKQPTNNWSDDAPSEPVGD